MAIKAGSSNSITQHPRVASPGWAAFDRLQRQKQGIECETSGDPYPPITSTNDQQINLPAACCQQIKTFSWVVQTEDTPKGGGFNSGYRKTNNYHSVGTNSASPVETLKKFHSWAKEDLVQDILAAVNNDEQQASSVLKAMSSLDNNEDEKDFLNSTTVPKGHLDECRTKYSGDCELLVSQEFVYTAGEPSTLKHPFATPVEPEWEEDGIYLTHRRDAVKMMRAASKHSRAASNAFSRGDHISARQLSLKAQGERAAAEMLNSKAAAEILRIRNDTNDIWKLDLHGLHASEAVNVLKEHLYKIEFMQMMTSSTYSHETAKLANGALSFEAASTQASTNRHEAMSRPRWMVLQVITGTGNHSRGQAALPAAVRGFLIEHGYNFDNARPGVLVVRPKFRFR